MRKLIEQNDNIDQMQSRIKGFEVESKSSKIRIEALESWINKQEKIIDKINSKLEEDPTKE